MEFNKGCFVNGLLHRSHVYIFSISDYGESSVKALSNCLHRSKKFKDPESINQLDFHRDSRLQQMQLSHDSSCSYMQQGHKPISFASANVFYSFLVQTSAIWNTTINQVLKVKDKIHFLYQSGKKGFVLPKTHI